MSTDIIAQGVMLPKITSPVDYARAWCEAAGVELADLGIGDETITIWIRLLPGVNYWRRFASVNMFKRVEFVVLSEDTIVVTPPPPPWWASLTPGQQVKAAKAPTSVYRDFGVTFDRFVPSGTVMTVAADGVSGAFVQVFRGATFQLWARGDDLRPSG